MKYFSLLFLLFFFTAIASAQIEGLDFELEHHYADNDGVKIHYVTSGEGPLILFVHGFPDFWFGWRHQMQSLSSDYRVAALDLRGYNLSDKPQGVEYYQYNFLIEDIATVIHASKEKSVYLVAHDWGAAISWRVAAKYPELIKKLIILSISHPKAGDKKSAKVTGKQEPSYVDYFVSKQFSEQLDASWFSRWVRGESARKYYREAFLNSDKQAMINYYRANYPTLDNLKSKEFLSRKSDLPNLKMPVMVIHGEKDTYALTKAHNNTWDFIDNEFSLHVFPEAGHFIQQDKSDRLTELIRRFVSGE